MPFSVNLTMTNCPEYGWQTGATLHKHEGASWRTVAAPLWAAVALCWALIKSLCQKSRATGVRYLTSSPWKQTTEPNGIRGQGLKENCFLPLPTSEAEWHSKALAVLKRLKVFHFTRCVLLLILGRRAFSLRERKCVMQLSSETLVPKTPYTKVRIGCLRAC